MNSKLTSSNFELYGYLDSTGQLNLNFANGLRLELYVHLDDYSNIKLIRPHAQLYFGRFQVHAFDLTESLPFLRVDGVIEKKYTNLKYWIYIKSKHSERKELVAKLKTLKLK